MCIEGGRNAPCSLHWGVMGWHSHPDDEAGPIGDTTHALEKQEGSTKGPHISSTLTNQSSQNSSLCSLKPIPSLESTTKR